MAAQLGGLRIGASVDIQRTDGRIHSATVVSMDQDKQVIVAEWYEKGETKGKELEFSTVFALNPGLQDVNRNSVKKLMRDPREIPSRVHMRDPRELPSRLPRHTQVPLASAKSGTIQDRRSLARPALHQQNGHDRAMGPPPAPLPTTKSSNIISSMAEKDVPMNSVVTRQSQQQPPRALVAPSGSASDLSAANRRRTNVVKEVDRIKKQREERRARQLSQIEEKRERMNVDPGNPNWEFLSMIREYRSTLDFRPLSMNDPSEVHQICVAVRKRPLNKKEVNRKEVDVITVPNRDLIVVHEPKLKVDLTKFLENSTFRFDYAFDETANNELVYKYTARPLVQTIFDGGMATCFAYGQTGSGKTHTMGGDFSGKTQDCSKGIYALATKDVFKLLKSLKYKNEDLVVSSSFFEIYSGKVFDLLNAKAKLRVLEDGRQQVQVVGLVEREVDSVEEVLKLIQHGNSVRTSGQTSANQNSSRSHAVFQIILRQRKSSRLHGKFSLIDLAGNERGADTSSANRQTRMEGAEINKSLLALKECIRALGRRGAHLPFRASKLTQVLRDSFIGENSRTCMIAMISPGLSSCEHSLNTLRYADRVKELGVEDSPELKPPSNEDEEMAPESEEDDNLALLRASDDVEMSGDMYTFHEAISHLQEMEEEILDLHKTVVEASQAWVHQDMDLLTMTNEVDYDLDLYVQKLKDLLAEKMEVLSKFNEKVTGFQQHLAEEEKMSMNIKRPVK
ncbi:kinesin-like protein KIF2A isoform X5 [Dermacentor variabilis]|uniref:kinesin-like protein KIF2A isoform X5 n=1 Tax=Dermacentor variabilis TaxID=34621 RepID=UPI003F5B7EE6